MKQSLNTMLVVTEVMQLLGVTKSRVHNLIQSEVLDTHMATPKEIAELLESDRIKAVPLTGIRLISSESAQAALKRPTKRGWKKGRPRTRKHLD